MNIKSIFGWVNTRTERTSEYVTTFVKHWKTNKQDFKLILRKDESSGYIFFLVDKVKNITISGWVSQGNDALLLHKDLFMNDIDTQYLVDNILPYYINKRAAIQKRTYSTIQDIRLRRKVQFEDDILSAYR